MDWTLLGQLLGGLGLFLLGMDQMTSGLKRAAGPSLKSILRRATQSRLRGLITGTTLTALVQSSSAITVATLGFVNAGLMTLGQSITVIYGSNIGTTLTGWLVAMLGFKLKIGALMLPFIGLGMAMNLFGRERRIASYGMAIAGFGLFFVGLDILKTAFEGLSEQFDLTQLGTGPLSLVLFTVAGIVLTTLTQASAVVMAIALSLLHSGSIGISAAAAIVIGANVGTTTTALLASIGATPNAKRISAAHVIFNVQTALIGTLILIAISGVLDGLDVEVWDPVILLAVFHTLFNVLGVAIIWPTTGALERFLANRFRSLEEVESRPQFLDQALLTTPSLAVEGTNQELARANRMAITLAENALSSEQGSPSLARRKDAIQLLTYQIVEFNQKLARQNITADIAETLPISTRVARYISEIARLASELAQAQPNLDEINDDSINRAVIEFKRHIINLLEACAVDAGLDVQGIDGHRLMRGIKQEYQTVKHLILERTIDGALTTEESIVLLDYLGELKRLASQAEDVSTHWSSTLPIQVRTDLIDTSKPA